MSEMIERGLLFDRLATIYDPDPNALKAKIYAVIQGMDGLNITACLLCRNYQWLNNTPVCIKHMSSEWKPDEFCSKGEPIPKEEK